MSVPVTLALLMLGLASVASAIVTQDPFGAMVVHRPAEPVPVPDVTFRSLEGREVRVRDLRGRAVLLGFFTTS